MYDSLRIGAISGLFVGFIASIILASVLIFLLDSVFAFHTLVNSLSIGFANAFFFGLVIDYIYKKPTWD